MRVLWCGIIVLVLILVLVRRPPVAPEPSQITAATAASELPALVKGKESTPATPAVMLEEDFEQCNPGDLPPAFRQGMGAWCVAQRDGRVLHGIPDKRAGDGINAMIAFGAADWQNYSVAFRFRYDEMPQALTLRVRCNGGMEDYYNLHLDAKMALLAAFERGEWQMVKYEHKLPPAGEWHTYRAICRDHHIEVFVNGTQIVDAPVDTAIRGQCELFIKGGTLLVDDLRVAPLDAPVPGEKGGDF